jgi:tRNA G46 methylase TrmB
VEAIEQVIPHLKPGSVIVFASDASPYADADIDGLAKKLKDKQIKLISLISGDCSDGPSAWNDVESELNN